MKYVETSSRDVNSFGVGPWGKGKGYFGGKLHAAIQTHASARRGQVRKGGKEHSRTESQQAPSCMLCARDFAPLPRVNRRVPVNFFSSSSALLDAHPTKRPWSIDFWPASPQISDVRRRRSIHLVSATRSAPCLVVPAFLPRPTEAGTALPLQVSSPPPWFPHSPHRHLAISSGLSTRPTTGRDLFIGIDSRGSRPFPSSHAALRKPH